jgi:hypothetical protein
MLALALQVQGSGNGPGSYFSSWPTSLAASSTRSKREELAHWPVLDGIQPRDCSPYLAGRTVAVLSVAMGIVGQSAGSLRLIADGTMRQGTRLLASPLPRARRNDSVLSARRRRRSERDDANRLRLALHPDSPPYRRR